MVHLSGRLPPVDDFLYEGFGSAEHAPAWSRRPRAHGRVSLIRSRRWSRKRERLSIHGYGGNVVSFLGIWRVLRYADDLDRVAEALARSAYEAVLDRHVAEVSMTAWADERDSH